MPASTAWAQRMYMRDRQLVHALPVMCGYSPHRYAKPLAYGISSLLAEGIYDPENVPEDVAMAILIVLEVSNLFSSPDNQTFA